MLTEIVDKIRFRLSPDTLLAALRLAQDDESAGEIAALALEAERLACPRAMFGTAYVDELGRDYAVIGGVRFSGRLLGVNLEGVYKVFPFAVTCGRELWEWSQGKSDPLEQFAADVAMRRALEAARRALQDRLRAGVFSGKTAVMQPGSLEGWRIEDQKPLFALLGDPLSAIGVELTESCLMLPTKSASGIIFPNDTGFVNCQLCPRPDCPGRRAPYDERKRREARG